MISLLLSFITLSTYSYFDKLALFALVIVGRAITIPRAIQKRSYKSMYKTDAKREAKRLRATTFAFAKSKSKER